jgi:hypothetical protein
MSTVRQLWPIEEKIIFENMYINVHINSGAKTETSVRRRKILQKIAEKDDVKSFCFK